MDIFDTKTVTPMLIGESRRQPFNDAHYIYELKLDGTRCFAYLDDTGTELRNKRNKRISAIFPELSNIYKNVKTRCILDGEVIVLKGGRTDFYELLRRSLMSSPVMIEMAAKKHPVNFVAFDIVYVDNRELIYLPLMERKKILTDTVTEAPGIALSRYIETGGIEYFNNVKERDLEGVIAKRKDCKYYFSRRTKDWIKIKATSDDDFVICGYCYDKGNVVSLFLGSYHDNKLVYRGNVAAAISRSDFKIISSAKQASKSFYPDFPAVENAVWLEPVLVGTVEFLEHLSHGGLRAPVFKGLRDDKLPAECIFD